MKIIQIIFLFIVIHYSVSGQVINLLEDNCSEDSNKNLYLDADEWPKPKKGYPFQKKNFYLKLF